ncbi:MAG: hypothetical protein HY747_00345 [Elusimicrobia bacterium]|nr:hypothetical protein [Elusimicrobiota bacterium]
MAPEKIQPQKAVNLRASIRGDKFAKGFMNTKLAPGLAFSNVQIVFSIWKPCNSIELASGFCCVPENKAARVFSSQEGHESFWA